MNKGETHGTTNKYIWLIEILGQPKTFMQVQELWKKCSLNNNLGQPLDRKTFYNWRRTIFDFYGVKIKTTRAGAESSYQVESGPGRDNVRNWLIGTISVQNKLIANMSIRDRILLEDVPSSRECIDTVLDAIKQNRLISFDYEDYWEDPLTVPPMQPYDASRAAISSNVGSVPRHNVADNRPATAAAIRKFNIL